MKRKGFQNIFLIGFMGAGKTTIGKRLSKILKLKFYDTDKIIIKKCGKPVDRIFYEDGPEYFRGQEKAVFNNIISKVKNSVIATGGGFPVYIGIGKLKKRGLVILLKSSPDILFHRIKKRPLVKMLGGTKRTVGVLYKQRLPIYKKAHICINTTGRPITKLLNSIKEKYYEYYNC